MNLLIGESFIKKSTLGIQGRQYIVEISQGTVSSKLISTTGIISFTPVCTRNSDIFTKPRNKNDETSDKYTQLIIELNYKYYTYT